MRERNKQQGAPRIVTEVNYNYSAALILVSTKFLGVSKLDNIPFLSTLI